MLAISCITALKIIRFQFQNNLVLTSKDEEVSCTDTSPFRIKVSALSKILWVRQTASDLLVMKDIEIFFLFPTGVRYTFGDAIPKTNS